MAIVNNVNILKLSEFLPSVKHQLCDKHQDVIGGVLKSTNYSWLAYGPTILVVNNTNASIRTSWSFENEYDNSDITCVAELPLEKCQIPLLIVGISSVNSSKLCIFNPNTRKVIRTLQLNIQVRCVAMIEDGDVNNVHPLPEILGQMKGVLAIGGADGSVILTDLNREFIVRAIEGDLKCESNEDNPNELKLVSLEDTAVMMQLKLNKAQLFGDSLGIVLVDGGNIVDDGITALEYSKETACLYVGFSGGSWHIWNLISFRHLYNSPDSEFPVFGFAQLEPCDDPRHTVYVWVTCQAPSQSLPLASLYSISYGKKDFVQRYGSFYEDFQQCNLVFEMSPGEEVEGVTSARVVSVGTISKTINKPTNSCIGLPDCEGTQLRLTATVYSIERRCQIETRMLLFDLNRWYAEQMPSSIEETTVQLTRAGVVRSLLDISTLSSSHLVALNILENTVDVFTNPSVDTSCAQISFEVIGVNSEGVFHGEKLGAQKEWLRNSEIAGSRALIHPQQLYRACLNSGLSVIYVDCFDYDNPSVDEMRSYILSAWLEYKMFSCIMDCADCWSNGSHSVSGCTLSYLLDWLWSQFVHCKTVAHHLCRILFDGSGLEFDLAERKKLKHCKVLIHSAYTVYSQIVQKYSKFILNESTENKLRAMSLLISYIDQVVFFIYLGVLPELNHLGMPRSSIAYDSVRLQKYVSQRSLYLIRALDECRRTRPHISPPIQGLYMVDSFNFTNDGIKVIDYPPHSIQLLLRIWLKLEPSIKEKFSLSYYFLLDLMHICQDDKYRVCMEKVANYPNTLGMTTSQVCLVKALWHLDHSFYEDGMKILMSSQVLSSDITDSQNRSILRLLFIESRYNLALQYLTSKQPALHLLDDLKFEMSLLLSNNLINEAHLFQRTNSRFRDSLLIQFFTEQNITQLKNIIKLNLDSKEEATFIKFLKDQNDTRYDDLHIMFLISRAKFEEVVELHRKLKSRNGFRGTNARDRFVEGISSSISSVSRQLSNVDSIFQTYSIPKNVTKPLSVYVKTSMSEGFPAPQMNDIAVAALALKCAKRSSSVEQHQQHSNSQLESNNLLDGFTVMPTREVTGIRARPAPPTPHGKRIRSLEHDLSTNLLVRHEAKKQKLDNNKEILDKLEVERLLATPIIERRRPPRTAEHLDTSLPNSVPHSILKKISDNKTKTPIKGDKDDGSDQIDLTPRKSLRFTLPREERSSAKLKSSVRLSARRSLRNGSVGGRSPDKVEAMETSASSSSSLSTTDLSEDSMKDLVCSTPLQSSLKRGNSVDWKSIMEESKPKTLFTIGTGSTAGKSKSTSSNTTNKTYLDGFLRKMAMEPTGRKEENHVNVAVEEGKKCEESKNALGLENDLPETAAETTFVVNNRADLSKDRVNIDHASPSKTVTPKDKNQETAYRTRSAAALRSSKLVEDLLETPRTRLRKRLEQRVDNDKKNRADDISEEKRVSNEIQSTPTRRMQRIEMHMEKKIRLEIKEIEDDEDGSEEDEQLECVEEEDSCKEHKIEIVEVEMLEVPAAPQVSQHECQDAAIESEHIASADICDAKDTAKEAQNVQMVITDECIEKGSINDERELVSVNVEVKTLDKLEKQEVEKEKTERSSEKECAQVKNVTTENVDVRDDLKPVVKMPSVSCLTAATPRDYHALTPVSDPVMLGAVAPAQPLQDYFTGDDDEEDDDLYGDLEEAEEAEMPPKMDFDQPEEGGFGSLYQELYEPGNLQAATTVTTAPKPQKSDSDSSVICLDSDSESEAKNFSKNNSKLDYEVDSMDEEENNSPPLRSRSFFHDKFRKSPEYDDCEDEGEEEDEETDGESACDLNEEDEDAAEDVEEEEEMDEEDEENREQGTEDEDIEEIEESHSEGTAEVNDKEQVAIASDIKEVEPEVMGEKLVSDEVEEPKIVPVETVSPTVENIEPAETNDSQSMPTLSKELDSNVPSEHCDEQAPELVKEVEVETEGHKESDKMQDPKNTQDTVEDSFNLHIMEVTSIDKSEEVEELWLTPVVEEVNENAIKNDQVEDVKECSSSDKQASDIGELTLAALALKRRVEDVDMTSVDKSAKLNNETIPLNDNPPSQECAAPRIAENEEPLDKTKNVVSSVPLEGEQQSQDPSEIKLEVEQEMFTDNTMETETVDTTEAKPVEENKKAEDIVSNKEGVQVENAKKEGLEELENVVDKVDLSDTESDNHGFVDELSMAEQRDDKEENKNVNNASSITSKEIQHKSTINEESTNRKKGQEKESEEGKIISSVGVEMKILSNAVTPDVDRKETEAATVNMEVDVENDSQLDIGKLSVPAETETSSDVNFVDAESGEMKIPQTTADKEPKNQSANIPVDLFTLGKGQMFFGSPDDVKTSATELATFQVGRTSLSGLEESKTLNNDSKDDASSMDYSVAEMDMAMIVNDSVNTPARSTGTPCYTAADSVSKKNEHKSDSNMAVVIGANEEVSIQIAKADELAHVQEPLKEIEKTESEKLETFKNLVDRSKIKDNEQSVVESSLDYLELCLPEGSSLKPVSKRQLSPSRNRRAFSEQPYKSRGAVAIDNEVNNDEIPRRHTRKSLDVARLYPSKRRESMKRRRTQSEEGEEDSSSKFSFAEFIQTRHSITSKPSTSDTFSEESDQKHNLRERRSSCSHGDRSEKLRENLKHDAASKDVHTNAKDSKVSKKSSIQEETIAVQETKKSKRLSRKSSMIPSPPLDVIVEEETPKSVEVMAKQRRQKSLEPLTKKWKPLRLDFDSNEDEQQHSKELKDIPVKGRSEKARSLPPSLSPRRSSARLSILPIVNEEEELTEQKPPVPKSSRSKKSSTSTGSSNQVKKKFAHFGSTAEDMFQQPDVSSEQDISQEMRNKGKPRSLPDLSRKRKKSSVRTSILPDLPEVEEVKETESIKSRSSVTRQSSSGAQASTKTSINDSSIQSRDIITIASNASAWAEKMFGQAQAKWWAKIKEQQKSTKSAQTKDSSNENPLPVTSSPAAKTRSKTNVSPSNVSPFADLPSAKISTKKRKDADTESVKSDRSGRSSRAAKKDEIHSVKSEKAVKNTTRSSRKDIETSSVKSDRSTRSSRKEKEIELTSPESEKSVRSRRKNEVEILLLSTPDVTDQRTVANRRRRVSSTSSGQSQKKRVRNKKESSSSPATYASSNTSMQIDEAHLPSVSPEPEKNADVSLIVEEYAENRRLTRHQKSLLERSLTSDVHLPLKKSEGDESKAMVASSESEDDEEEDEEEVMFTPVRPRTRSKN